MINKIVTLLRTNFIMLIRCSLTHIFAETGRYASKGENGEDMRQFSANFSSIDVGISSIGLGT